MPKPEIRYAEFDDDGKTEWFICPWCGERHNRGSRGGLGLEWWCNHCKLAVGLDPDVEATMNDAMRD